MTTDANGATFSKCTSTILPLVPRKSHPRQGRSVRNESTVRDRQTRCRAGSTAQTGRTSVWFGRWISIHRFMFAVLIGFLLCPQAVAADNDDGRLQGRTELLIDRRKAPEPWLRFETRDESSIIPRDGTSKQSNYDRSASSQQQVALPHPFDSSLGNNFTSPSCPAFFRSFLANSEFNSCLPFSLLLQTSNGFFSITRSPVRLTETLDATCDVDYHQCSALMDSLAQQIQQSENCGNDFSMQNPLVLQAYNGFIAYQPLFHAGCLTDSHGNYCFANAITNVTSPTSSYIYYLPLGVALPGGTAPTCNTCLRQTMAVFATYATNSTQPLSGDYAAAAQQVDSSCGPRYVDTTVAATGAGSIILPSSAALGLSLLLAAVFLVL